MARDRSGIAGMLLRCYDHFSRLMLPNGIEKWQWHLAVRLF